MTDGLTNEQIASRLGISENGVSEILSRLSFSSDEKSTARQDERRGPGRHPRPALLRQRRSPAVGIASAATTALLILVLSCSQSGAQEPQPAPSDATVLAELEQIRQHYAGVTPEPLFAGEMNGFSFRPDGTPHYDACVNARPRLIASDSDSPLLRDSNLDFNPTYIPEGFTAEVIRPMSGPETGEVAVVFCDDTVVSVSSRWISSSGYLEVARLKTAPIIPSRFSSNRLEALVINDRPAIAVHQRAESEEVFIFMRDSGSFWTIKAKGLTMDVLIQVGRGID